MDIYKTIYGPVRVGRSSCRVQWYRKCDLTLTCTCILMVMKATGSQFDCIKLLVIIPALSTTIVNTHLLFWTIPLHIKAHSNRTITKAKAKLFFHVCRLYFDIFCWLFDLYRFRSFSQESLSLQWTLLSRPEPQKLKLYSKLSSVSGSWEKVMLSVSSVFLSTGCVPIPWCTGNVTQDAMSPLHSPLNLSWSLPLEEPDQEGSGQEGPVWIDLQIYFQKMIHVSFSKLNSMECVESVKYYLWSVLFSTWLNRIFYKFYRTNRIYIIIILVISHWWLVELPMWLTDGFLVTFFGRWKGAVRIHVSHVHTHESRTANMQGGGGCLESQTSENSKSLENLKFALRWQGALSAMLDLTNGSHLESKMAAT